MNRPFYAILLFDQDGYHSALTAPTETEVKAKVAVRTALVKSLRACTCPFLGTRNPQGIKDVSLPPEFRTDFAMLDPRKEES